jgi:hypothetical protein
MSMYENMVQSLEADTPNDYLHLLHDDYVFVRHQTGEEVTKEEWTVTVTGMFDAMKQGTLTWSNERCLYENSDILVFYNVGNFPDGTRESIIAVHSLKDGKIIRTESGATPIK